MLDRLFSSKTRVEILRLIFSNPDGRYYVRQISREIGRDISGIKRELDNLDKAGLLTSEKFGNLRYYSANKSSVIYGEIKSIIAKTVGVQGVIAGSLATLGGLRQAWMYSMNSHPPGEGSGPVPVLIVGQVDLTELNEAVTQLERKLEREINYTVFDEVEFQRRRADADPFLTEVFDGKNVLLIGRDNGI